MPFHVAAKIQRSRFSCARTVDHISTCLLPWIASNGSYLSQALVPRRSDADSYATAARASCQPVWPCRSQEDTRIERVMHREDAMHIFQRIPLAATLLGRPAPCPRCSAQLAVRGPGTIPTAADRRISRLLHGSRQKGVCAQFWLWHQNSSIPSGDWDTLGIRVCTCPLVDAQYDMPLALCRSSRWSC
jgi:hypothetical protein